MKKLATLACVAALSGPAYADSNWEYAASMYGWATGLKSAVDTPLGPVEAELSFSDLLDSLDMAFMGTFEARNGRWALITDLFYSDLSNATGTPLGLVFTTVDIDTKMSFLSAYAAYRVVDTPSAKVDVGGGIRRYNLDMDVGLSGGAAQPVSFNFGDTWIDPVIGARVRAPINDKWFFSGYADVGGFNIGGASDLSWQVFASIGYQFNERWSTQLGYRYMSVEKNIDGSDMKLELFGPMIGVTARF